MNKRKYVPPRCVDIDPKTIKDPKLLEAIRKLQQMAEENRKSGEGRHYYIEIDPSTVKAPEGLEAIQKLERFGQEIREGCEAVKRSRLFLKLRRPLPNQK